MTAWLLILAVVGAVGCSSECDLRAGLGSYAGSGATDCGHVVLGADSAAVDACVATAFESETPFVAQYDEMGSDSKVVLGIAGDVNGTVTFLVWDGDPSGGSGEDAVISGDRCLGPSLQSSSMGDPFAMSPITCMSTSSLGRTCG